MAEALARAQQLIEGASDQLDSTEPYAACQALLEPWADEALRALRSKEDRLWWTLAVCRFAAVDGRQPRVTAPDLLAWVTPWHQAWQRQTEPDPLLELQWAMTVRSLMAAIGLPRDASALLLESTARSLATFRAAPDDLQAKAELTMIVSWMLGDWQFEDDVRGVQAMFERELGEANRFNLLLLRIRAYHERFMGRPQAALGLIERAVALTRAHHPQDVMLAAHMATEHGACLSSAGRLGEALQRLIQARPVFLAQQPVVPTNLVRTDTNLAMIALDMGDFRAAIAYADQATERALATGDRTLAIEAKVSRATREVARLQLGESGAAQALRAVLQEEMNGEMHSGSAAVALVEHAARSGDADLLAWAAEFADLHIRRFRAPLQADAALRPLMQAWREGGHALQPAAVRPPLDRALAISLTGRSPSTLSLTQFSLARHLARTEPETALWLYKRSANTLQLMRSGLPTGESELHHSWLGQYEADLRAFIGLLIDEGRLVEAEQALALLRDEEGHEFSRRSVARRSGAGQTLSYTPVEAQRNAMMAGVAQQAERAALAADAKLDARGLRALRSNYRDPQADAAIDELTVAVQRVVDEAPTARGVASTALPNTRLPAGTARLTYFVRERAIDIVLQQGRTMARHTVLVARAELNRVIQAARGALGSPQTDALPALQTLHRWLLAPLAPALQRAGIRHLQCVPDAALRYVPFGALHDGHQHVVQRYVVSTRWSGSAGEEQAPASAPAPHRGGTLALGRTAGDAAHSALPGVQQEIATLHRAGAQVWADADFTEARLSEGLAQGPDVVHLASHFVLDPAGEEKSYLLLGDGQRLPLSTLAAMPWRGVQLALLSACDSGVAMEAGPGQALVGFATTLQRAGVANVLATLWRVSDGATARWVELFYRSPERGPGQSAARPPRLDARRAALAQRQWIQQYAGTPLGHPHYWAGFTWLGRD